MNGGKLKAQRARPTPPLTARVGWLKVRRPGGSIQWLVVEVGADALAGRPAAVLSLAQAHAVNRELIKYEDRRN